MNARVERTLLDILDREDAGQTGVVTNRPSDRGGLTKWGVTFDSYNAWLKQQGKPPLLPTEFPQLTKDEAIAFMLDSIGGSFASLADLGSGALYAYLFDWAELSGPGRAVRGLQTMLRDLGHDLTVDGVYGPKTESALYPGAMTYYGEENLIHRLVLMRATQLVEVVLRDGAVEALMHSDGTTQLGNLKGWVRRAIASGLNLPL